MKAALWKSWEDFTPDTPYESHPAFTLVAQMFVRGGNRHYRPAGYVEPSGFTVRGPSPAAEAFEATIDAWLEVQGARLRSHGYDRGMPAPAPAAKPSHRL